MGKSSSGTLGLRVVSTSELHQLLLPPAGGLFEQVDFVHLLPESAPYREPKSSLTNTISLIVNPQSFSCREICGDASRIWLWSLETLGGPDSAFAKTAPQSHKFFTEQVSRVRKKFLRAVGENVELVVVPDSQSQAFLRSRGISSVISPPAINNGFGRGRRNNLLDSKVVAVSVNDEVGRAFYEAGKNRLTVLNPRDSHFRDQLLSSSHLVNLQNAQLDPFPLLAAASLYSGIALVTRALRSQWGFEPGIDYLQVSSPDELYHVLEKLALSPRLTQLMGYRARQKAAIFESSAVFERLYNKRQ